MSTIVFVHAHPDDEASGTAGSMARASDEEDADIVTGYDWHGGYGYPDHVMVHRIVRRAVELAGRRPRLLEVTMNRDAMRAMSVAAQAAGLATADWDPDGPGDDGNPIGTPEAEIHLRVDVLPYLERKRSALAAHASQTSDVGMMLSLPDEAFTAMFRDEYYLEPGREPGMRTGWILDAS